MRLTISTPAAIALDIEGIQSLRAEDESGSFGILPGHADLMTALAPSVLVWRDAKGGEGYCAVRGGVLDVRGGDRVSVATREAVVGDDLERMEREVLRRFRSVVAAESEARLGEARLHLALVRRLVLYLRPGPVRRERPMHRATLSDLE